MSKVEKEAKRAGRSVDKQVRRSGRQIGNQLARSTPDIMTGGITTAFREMGKAMQSDIKPDYTAAKLLEAQEIASKNYNADLTLENIADVQAGGTAAQAGTSAARRRKRTGQSPSASIGINV